MVIKKPNKHPEIVYLFIIYIVYAQMYMYINLPIKETQNNWAPRKA